LYNKSPQKEYEDVVPVLRQKKAAKSNSKKFWDEQPIKSD
jgi:hypothetical protein